MKTPASLTWAVLFSLFSLAHGRRGGGGFGYYDDGEEGLSTGEIIGIVIGVSLNICALLADGYMFRLPLCFILPNLAYPSLQKI